MVLKFNKIDEKLISYVYHHGRESFSRIAKQCGLSRDQVEYRLNKYETQGFFKKYAAIFDYSKLGFSEFTIVFIKLNSSLKKKQLFREKFMENKNVVTLLDVLGEYDFVIDFISKTREEFNESFSKSLKDFEDVVQKQSFFTVTKMIFFPLKKFGVKEQKTNYSMITKNDEFPISSTEKKIIVCLERNARSKIINIAKECNLSSETVLYQIRKLQKNNVFLGTRIIFDMEKIGYYFSLLRLQLKNNNEKIKREIESYCNQETYVNSLSFGIGENTCQIQIMYANEKNFRDTIKRILKTFNELILQSDVLLIENESTVRTIPTY